MFSLFTEPNRGLTRRELLRVGGLGMVGLSMTDLARLRALSAPTATNAKRRRNSCVFLFLLGGPSQVDLFDMKPAAPAEIRGEFTPSATKVPGIRICEHLPLLGKHMDKLCLVRSMTHHMNVHGPACSEIFSGRPYFGPPTTDQANREDWPSLSSLVMRYGRPHAGLPPSVVLPWYVQFPGQAKRIAGQTGGRMNERYNAFLLRGDLGQADFEIEGLRPAPDVPLGRLHRRRGLLQQLEGPLPLRPPVRPVD